MTNKILTQDRLKELYRYDPDTGYFYRIKISGNNGPLGKVTNKPMWGYLRIKIDNEEYHQHRLAFLYMEGCLPANQVDHINHVGTDNCWANLRHVSHRGNSLNQKLKQSNVSGFNGVSWSIKENKWMAKICVKGKDIWLGYHRNKKDAIEARKAANLKYNFHPNHGVNP